MTTARKIFPALLLMLATLVGFSPPAQAEGLTTWTTKTVTLESGRRYFALTPNCSGGCTTARQLVIYTHGAGAPEDVINAGIKLQELRNATPDVIFAYSISKDGSKRFDVGVDYCCTWVDHQEIQYLTNVVDSVAAATPVDRTNVKLMGVSNGGKLSERGACLRPDVFSAAASWAGTWRTWAEGCMHGVVTIEQWHGTADTVVPIDGGTVHLWGHDIVVPPAAELGTKILPESHFFLHRIEGEDHVASGAIIREMTRWLASQ